MDLSEFGYILNELGFMAFAKLSASRFLSINHYYILRRSTANINLDATTVQAKLKLSPICENDIDEILRSQAECDVSDKKQILSRMLFLKSGFENCHVIRIKNKIAYMQWIIYPTENGIIKERYGNKFYPLNDEQVMIENAFTFPPYRGLGYLQSGTLQLLDLARAKGFRSSVCYIRKDNINSLREFTKMGFQITKLVTEYKLFGKVWRTL